MLLVPLVLSAPSLPGTGDEVVLAAGPGLADEEDAGDPAADLEVELEAEGVVASSEDEVTDAAPPTKRKKSAKKPPAKRAGTASTAKAKSAAPKGSGTTVAVAAVAAVTKAAAAEAAPAPAPPPPPAPAPPEPPPAPAPTAAPASGSNTDWDRLAHCESGNTNDPGAPYYGYWQFSAGTWQSVGEPGLPNEHSRERQLAAAKRLHAARGWAPWPDCSRRLGLR